MRLLFGLVFLVILDCALLASNQHKPLELRIEQ